MLIILSTNKFLFLPLLFQYSSSSWCESWTSEKILFHSFPVPSKTYVNTFSESLMPIQYLSLFSLFQINNNISKASVLHVEERIMKKKEHRSNTQSRTLEFYVKNLNLQKIMKPHANPLYYHRDYRRRRENFTVVLYLQWHTHLTLMTISPLQRNQSYKL